MSQTDVLLGVNIDYVVALSSANSAQCPDPLLAVLQTERLEADSNTLHMHESQL